MDILYRLGEATVSEVLAEMPDSPTYNNVRNKLTVMEEKGHVTHRKSGKRFVYVPSEKVSAAGRLVVQHVVKTFFQGSPSSAALALLGMSAEDLTDQDIDEIEEWIADARSRRD